MEDLEITFWTECKTKTFWNAGRKGVQLWILAAICLPNCPTATSHGGSFGLWACPRPADCKAEVQIRHLSCAHSSVWYCPPGVLARNKWALSGLCRDPCLGPSSLPCHGAASECQLDFGLKSLLEQRLQLCFSENSSDFLLYNPALCITYPLVPLPDKLILPFPFFNRETGA